MNVVEEGVANFRAYQSRSNTYFDRSEARMDAEEKAQKLADKRRWTRSNKIAFLAILAVVLMPPTTWFVVQAKVMIEDLMQFTDWYEKHKANFQKNSSLTDPNLGVKSQQDDAGGAWPAGGK